jgi:hypothetical protein
MTDKELRRLRRQDLLQLLLAQGHEAEKLKRQLEASDAQLAESEQTCERLKRRLDDKDKQINKLKGRLDRKDAQLHNMREIMERRQTSRRIELEEAGSIAEAALRLNDIFNIAQKAADQYIYNLKVLSGEEEAEDEYEAADNRRLGEIDAELAAEAAEDAEQSQESEGEHA